MYYIKRNGLKYIIIEKSTDSVIRVYFNEQDAKRCLNTLNNGSAFRGETPFFFLDKKIQKYK